MTYKKKFCLIFRQIGNNIVIPGGSRTIDARNMLVIPGEILWFIYSILFVDKFFFLAFTLSMEKVVGSLSENKSRNKVGVICDWDTPWFTCYLILYWYASFQMHQVTVKYKNYSDIACIRNVTLFFFSTASYILCWLFWRGLYLVVTFAFFFFFCKLVWVMFPSYQTKRQTIG